MGAIGQAVSWAGLAVKGAAVLGEKAVDAIGKNRPEWLRGTGAFGIARTVGTAAHIGGALATGNPQPLVWALTSATVNMQLAGQQMATN
jgi:hypothetical protein